MNVKMKNTFKNILILAAAVFGLAACQEEVADVQGVVGDFAYIVDGTEAKYAGANCEVFHTPIGEMGEIATSVTVALTKVQKSDVNVVLALDNTSLDNGYAAFPAGVLKFNENVTIPAGEKEVTVEVTAANADFEKLTELKYQAIFRIASASGVKVSSNSNAAYLMVLTETIDPSKNVVTVPASTSTYQLKHYADASVTTDISKTITLTGTEPAFMAFDIQLAVDNDLIAEYNAANGSSYLPLPEDVTVNFTSPITMEQDATSVSATISISKEDQLKLTADEGYLVPVVIVDAGDATVDVNHGITYLAINVLNFEGSQNCFSALYLGDYRMATWYKFPTAWNLTNGYTYVFHVFIDEVTNHSRIGNFSDANEGWINMLRYGERGNKDTRLEWWVGPGNLRKKLYAPAIEPQKWYQYALVYNKNSYIMYLEGEEVARVDLTDEEKATLNATPPAFQAIEFNSSWVEGYRSGNEFHGRFWNFSVWGTALSQANIKQCYRGMNITSWSTLRNCAFWAFDEGYGHIVNQTKGYKTMGSIDFSKTTRVETESGGYEDADVSAYVQWKQDDYNNFD